MMIIINIKWTGTGIRSAL